ncbi:MAG: HAMP domain-containing protein, partial [Sphingomonadales bacterium]
MKNVSIIGKFFVLLASFGVFGIAVAYYAGTQLQSVDETYSELIDTNAKASLLMAKANRALQTARAAVGDLMMSRSDALNKSSAAELAAARAGFVDFIDKVIQAMPADGDIPVLRAAALEAVDKDCGAVIEFAAKAVTEADVKVSQDRYLKECQPKFPVLSKTFIEKANALSKAVDDRSVEVSDTTASIVTNTWGMILAGLALVGVAGFFGVRAWLVKPIKELEGTMVKLSAGDFAVEVMGIERRDEIGAMSRSVQVFKDAGLENRRMTASAIEAETAKLALRDRQSALDNSKAEDLKAFVLAVEQGFNALAGEDESLEILRLGIVERRLAVAQCQLRRLGLDGR